MAHNPTPVTNDPAETDPHREHRVRERAYHLWEAEGKPHGRDQEFWHRARELEAPVPHTPQAPAAPKPRATRAKPASPDAPPAPKRKTTRTKKAAP